MLSGADPEIAGKRALPEESVLGNLFFSILAGHETTGSAMSFIFLLMAIYPDMQRKLQDQLDEQFGDRPLSEWTIEHDYQPLQKGLLGAIQKEVLTLYNPATFLMRKVIEPVTVIDSSGQSHIIPADTLTPIPYAAAFRNPAIWKRPSVQATTEPDLLDSPALYFNPDRWMGTFEDLSEDALVQDSEFPTWYAYGQGPRSCPGRAFAQIEMTAVMATLFKHHSLELEVDDKVVAQSGGDEHLAWEKTRDGAIKALYTDVSQNISIVMEKVLPIRVVERTS